MTDWLQFSFLDMTPYDQQGWFWLIASYQQDYPYLALFALLHTVLLLLLIARPIPHAPRIALGLLVLSWAWCGAVFQWQYHGSMNWAAVQIGWAFLAQAAVLTLLALTARNLRWASMNWRTCWPGCVVLVVAIAYPLFGLIEGRTLAQLEWPGVMAQPVTLTTLGVLMLLARRYWLLLMPIPLIWALVSAAFTLKLDLLEPYVTCGVLILVVVAAFRGAQSAQR